MRLNQFQLKKPYSRNVNFSFISRRSYSTSSSSKVDIPIPILTITDLQNKDYIFSKRELPFFFIKKKIGGIYSFLNKVNGKQYIGSAKDLYLRLNEHLSHRK